MSLRPYSDVMGLEIDEDDARELEEYLEPRWTEDWAEDIPETMDTLTLFDLLNPPAAEPFLKTALWGTQNGNPQRFCTQRGTDGNVELCIFGQDTAAKGAALFRYPVYTKDELVDVHVSWYSHRKDDSAGQWFCVTQPHGSTMVHFCGDVGPKVEEALHTYLLRRPPPVMDVES